MLYQSKILPDKHIKFEQGAPVYFLHVQLLLSWWLFLNEIISTLFPHQNSC